MGVGVGVLLDMTTGLCVFISCSYERCACLCVLLDMTTGLCVFISCGYERGMCVCMCVRACVCVCLCVCMRVCVCVCVCVCVLYHTRIQEHKEVYSPLTLKCTLEFVLVTFHSQENNRKQVQA